MDRINRMCLMRIDSPIFISNSANDIRPKSRNILILNTYEIEYNQAKLQKRKKNEIELTIKLFIPARKLFTHIQFALDLCLPCCYICGRD